MKTAWTSSRFVVPCICNTGGTRRHHRDRVELLGYKVGQLRYMRDCQATIAMLERELTAVERCLRIDEERSERVRVLGAAS